MPGLIDVHAHHWTLWGGHFAQPWEYRASLAFGVTSMRDPQPRQSDVLTYGDRLDAGDMLGPRMFSTGRGVFAEVGLQSLDDARQVLRRYSRYYRTHTVKQYLVGGRLERQWFAIAAREQGLTPTTEGGEDLKMNLTLVLDGYSGLEHAINTTPLYRDVTELMARSGIAYTLTVEASQRAFKYFDDRYPILEDEKLLRFVPRAALDALHLRASSMPEGDPALIAARAADAAKIVSAGGKVALGTHGELAGLGPHWELWALQSGGLPPYEALRAAASVSAQAIGLGSQLGSLEPGKLADLLVLDGDPLLDIHHSRDIRYVMKNGRLYEADTLREVWPRLGAGASQASLPEP